MQSHLFHFMAAYLLVLITPGSIMLSVGGLAAVIGVARTAPFIAGVALGAGLMTMCAGVAVDTLLSFLHPALPRTASAAVMTAIALLMLRAPRMGESVAWKVTNGSTAALTGVGLLTALSSPLTAIFTTAMFANPQTQDHGIESVLLAAMLVTTANLFWYGAMAWLVTRPVVRSKMLEYQPLVKALTAGLLLMLASLVLVNV